VFAAALTQQAGPATLAGLLLLGGVAGVAILGLVAIRASTATGDAEPEGVEAFVEALSGYRFSDDGVLHQIADSETAALRAQLRVPVENASEWQPLITWWLTAPQNRPVRPGANPNERKTP